MESVFDIGAKVAQSGWLALALALVLPGQRPALILYAGRVLPALIALAYATLLGLYLTDPPPMPADPSSIAGVRQLLAPDAGIGAAWFHFLAYDLVFGAWAVTDGLARGLPRLGLLVVMLVTYFAGPVGLLTYLLLRALPRPAKAALAS